MIRTEAVERLDVGNERRKVRSADPLVSHRCGSDGHCVLVRKTTSTALSVTDLEGIAGAANASYTVSTQEASSEPHDLLLGVRTRYIRALTTEPE